VCYRYSKRVSIASVVSSVGVRTSSGETVVHVRVFDGVQWLMTKMTCRRPEAVLTSMQLVEVVISERLRALETAPFPLCGIERLLVFRFSSKQRPCV